MGIAERKEREKKQRRNDIIDAAEKVFFSKGSEIATMDDVAQESELSKGTLYLYFKSKEDLQFAISIRGAEILREMITQGLSPDKSGYENLLEMAAIFIDFSKRYHNYFQLLLYFQTSNLSEAKIDELSIEKYLTQQSPLAQLNECVEKGIKDGSLRKDIPSGLLGATLWSQIMGLLVVLENKKNVYELFGVNEMEVLQAHLEIVTNGAGRKSKASKA